VIIILVGSGRHCKERQVTQSIREESSKKWKTEQETSFS
jgi:hypothetical protein